MDTPRADELDGRLLGSWNLLGIFRNEHERERKDDESLKRIFSSTTVVLISGCAAYRKDALGSRKGDCAGEAGTVTVTFPSESIDE